ncbi:MAG: Com family DNA-binding transcriptional regulator [Sphingomonadales bacterium]|nr:MAG: Com family DNA-binding transcriptional regulator [Sphingomonadales bacterium]
MESIRCLTCAKLLARAAYTLLEIKCSLCGTVNALRAKSSPHERQRASETEAPYVSPD